MTNKLTVSVQCKVFILFFLITVSMVMVDLEESKPIIRKSRVIILSKSELRAMIKKKLIENGCEVLLKLASPVLQEEKRRMQLPALEKSKN